jgi:hypothetical protein
MGVPVNRPDVAAGAAGRGYAWLLAGALAAALGLRLLLLLTCLNTVNADQAVLGLMGKHILGGHFFTYFWENKYCGAFISYLAAINFRLFGMSVLSFKLATFPLVIASLLFTSALAKELYGRTAAALACLIMAFPPVYVTLFSVSPHGTYADTLAFGPAVLYLAYTVAGGKCAGRARYLMALLGLISGVACWISPLIVPFLAVAAVVLYSDNRPALKEHFPALAIGFVLGAMPMIVFNVRHPFATFLNLGSRPLDISKAGLSSDLAAAGPLGTALKYARAYAAGLPAAFLNTLLGAAGIFRLADPLTERYRALHVMLCAVYLAPVLYYSRRMRGPARNNICLYLVLASMLFSFLSFLKVPRFQLPMWPALAILGGAFISGMSGYRRRAAVLALTAVLGVNLAGAFLLSRLPAPPFAKLADHLLAEGYGWGYADYWTAYPLMFLSGEKLVVSPTLDPASIFPKSKGDYPFYTDRVAARGDVFYLTNDAPGSVALFEGKLAALKVTCHKEDYPPFMIYTSFSRRVYPEELGMPGTAASVPGQLFY